MGDVMLSSEDMEVKEIENVEKEKKVGESSKSLASWERFMPKMSLRVLLVEADDSTRQIVAALLRKCNYKVASVSDGLEAWEALKGKLNKIDLILTEVELPSISGYALLTLIMEHEICRNIPVIMMSPQDPISTVYKCMLKGASDYLVKPLRINELRNLWQHVWRKQILANGGNNVQNESVAVKQVEATSENTENRHSSDRECLHRAVECKGKGSEAQNSCTKRGLEDESADMETVHCVQSNERMSYPSDAEMQRRERLIVGDFEDGNATPSGKDIGPETPKSNTYVDCEASEGSDALINFTRETVGSAGVFNGLPLCKLDSSPRLDHCVRSLQSSCFETKASEEKRTLNHSRTSAFSLYMTKPLRIMNSITGSTDDQHKEDTAASERTSVNTYKSDICARLDTREVFGSLAIGQSEQSKVPISSPEVLPVSVPLRDVRYDDMWSSYPQFPPVAHLQPVRSQLTSLNTACQEDALYMTAFHQSSTGNSNSGRCNGLSKLAHSIINESVNGSLSIDGVNQLSRSGFAGGCGTSSSAPTDMRSDESIRRASLREAALVKFRQKRKDRCYEKKVRYESRKKLAEQRPRVKGQFVRHVLTDTTKVELECQNPNSLDG